MVMKHDLTRMPRSRAASWKLLVAVLAGATMAHAAPPTPAAILEAESYNFATGGQSLLVVHRGQVLHESYANGGGADRPQLLASGTKGFTGMIGAIAASDGLFDLDEPVAARALTEWQGSPEKSQITFRHLLTMTSGLGELHGVTGWADYLQAPVDHPAGSTFVYGPDPNLFGLALERLLGGEPVTAYMDRRLFQPLGIASIRWGSNFQDGHPQLSGGAYVTSREWAAFGEFVRRMADRSWTGPSLLAPEYFDQVLTGNPAHPAYGFYWWLKNPVPPDLAAIIDANNGQQYSRQIAPIVDDPSIPDDFAMAAGAYDQRLYVIPSRELVVVRNGPPVDGGFEDTEFLDRLLLPSEPSASCVSGPTVACLHDDRFRVEAVFLTGSGASGTARAVELTDDTAYFWFFSSANLEMVVKVLDACAPDLGSRYWVFAGGLTDVRVDWQVTDTRTGVVRTYANPQGSPFLPVQDTAAFATCP